MGKADKQTARNMNWDTRTSDTAQGNAGISNTEDRSKILTPEDDQMRESTNNAFRTMNDPSTSAFSTSGGKPSYLGTFENMTSPTAGLDWSGVDSGAAKLANTSGNYGTTQNAQQGLSQFAATGGLTPTDMSSVNRPTLENFEQTGGYSAGDLANLRARGNSAIASTYANTADQMARDKAASGQFGPGYSAAGFKMLRQGAQDIGNQAQTTEANIADSVRNGRMQAATTLAGNNLNLLGLKSNNTLQGYGTAGNLDLQRNQQINQATQNSIADYLSKNGMISSANLAGAQGQQSDALNRAQGMDTARAQGAQGMLNTYGTTANENNANNQLEYNYRRGLAGDLNQTTQNQLQVNQAPGIMSDIGGAVDLAGSIAPMIAGIPKMFGAGGQGITGGAMGGPSSTLPTGSMGSYGNASNFINPNMWNPSGSSNGLGSYGNINY